MKPRIHKKEIQKHYSTPKCDLESTCFPSIKETESKTQHSSSILTDLGLTQGGLSMLAQLSQVKVLGLLYILQLNRDTGAKHLSKQGLEVPLF